MEKCKNCKIFFNNIRINFQNKKYRVKYCSDKCKKESLVKMNLGKNNPRYGKHHIGWNRGKKATKGQLRGLKLGWLNKNMELNPQWKGDNVGNGALHSWIKRHKPKPELCENCKKVPPYDLANISGKYLRDTKDYKWMCRKCHMEEDGRLNNFKKSRCKYGV